MGLLQWAVSALIVSLIAGALGFSRPAHGVAQLAKVLFGLFLVIALVMLVMIVLGVGAATA